MTPRTPANVGRLFCQSPDTSGSAWLRSPLGLVTHLSVCLAVCCLMQGCAYLGVGIMKSERESCSEVKIGERPAAGGATTYPPMPWYTTQNGCKRIGVI